MAIVTRWSLYHPLQFEKILKAIDIAFPEKRNDDLFCGEVVDAFKDTAKSFQTADDLAIAIAEYFDDVPLYESVSEDSKEGLDLFNDEFGTYGFHCYRVDNVPLHYKNGDESFFISDAWGHEYYVHGYSYNNYKEWRNDAEIASDDPDFCNTEDYLAELLEYETIVWEQLYNAPLILRTRKRMPKSKKQLKERENPRSFKKRIPSDWQIDFSEDGGVWWVCNEKIGAAEEFDTHEAAVQYILNYEN